MTNLAGNLPRGDKNGLSAIVGELIDAPEVKHIVIMVVNCKKITTDTDTGEVNPTARILRIEAINRADYHTAETLMRRALERRHGSAMLPFDTEQEITKMFAEIQAEGGGFKDEQPPTDPEKADDDG